MNPQVQAMNPKAQAKNLCTHALHTLACLLWLCLTPQLVHAQADNSPAHAQADNMPAHVRAELPDARLSGEGSYRWFGLKIYDAALWVSRTSNAPLSEKFVLNLRYARELYGDRIAQASLDEIRHLRLGTAAQHQAWLASMQALFPDVTDGSQISGVYLPHTGARFYLDGKLLGEIRDPEFSRAFFAIWLDPRTSASRLRNQLLGLS